MTQVVEAEAEKIVQEEQPAKTIVMALSFQNGRYVEVGLTPDGVEDMKKRAFAALKSSEILECENICFRCCDVAFTAFYERTANGSSTITESKIDSGS